MDVCSGGWMVYLRCFGVGCPSLSRLPDYTLMSARERAV